MKNVETELGCLGYYGFGGGYAEVKDQQHRIEVIGSEPRVAYCSTCPLRTECWTKHKELATQYFPAAMEEFMTRAAILSGPDLVKSWIAEFGSPDPLMALMSSNMQDGAAVAGGMAMPDRGERTLPWPMKSRQ